MDKIITVTVDARLAGKTVGQILRNEFRASAGVLRQLKKEEDGILVSGEPAFVTRRVCIGEEIRARIRDGQSEIEAEAIPLEILYEDEDVIAVNKPRNMPTHPSQNHHGDTLANALMYYFRGQSFIFRAITRLDKDTSGVVLVAKNPLSAAILAEEMKQGRIQKEYLAITCGTPNPKAGRIEVPIRRQTESVVLRCVSPDGKEAVTVYETLRENGRFALVRLAPLTGRTHQLRVHMCHIGTPIYGDDLYGAPQVGERTRLHCEKLRFFHPLTRQAYTVTAPLPADMTELPEV